MFRSHHHLRGFIKLVLWDVYCVNGYGSFQLGYVGVGFGRNPPYSMQGLLGKPETKRPLGRRKHRWEDNIKMGLQEAGWGWGHGLDLSGSGKE